MVDKNPYEKDDVDVPNFGEPESKENDPIFNMDTTSVTSETDTLSLEEEAESSSKVAIVVLIILLVLFLVGAVARLIFGFSKSKEVSTITEEYSAYKEKASKEINELQAKVSTLETELASLKSSGTTTGGESSTGTGTQTEANTYYSMDEGVGVRPSAGDTSKYADYNKLPTDIKDKVYQNGNTITTRSAKFPVYETKQVDGKNWGRIADNAWVCIDYGKKQ